MYKRQKYARVKCIRDADGVVVDYEVEGDFPKYGNDDDRVDGIASELGDTFMSYVKGNHTYRGGIRMAQKACEDNGYHVDPEVVELFTTHRKTHNAGVFDAYTPEMRACRSSHIITGPVSYTHLCVTVWTCFSYFQKLIII